MVTVETQSHGFVEDIRLPEVPAWASQPLRVQSYDSIPGAPPPKEETVDLVNYTCTCPQFLHERARFPAPDIRRACVHIVRALLSHHSAGELDDFLFGILNSDRCRENGVWLDSGRVRMKHFRLDDHHVLLIKDQTPWVEVIAQTDRPFQARPYKRFGFHTPTRRWLYGLAPRNAQSIALAIQHEFGVGRITRFKFAPSPEFWFVLRWVVLAGLLSATALILYDKTLSGG